MTSTLYLCANHIGCIKDLPLRTLETLKIADIILCEDTRSIGRLLASLGIHKPLTSYFDFNEEKRTREIRERLTKETLSIALISEAGMPLISDPGYRIVNLFHELGLPIIGIPGPSAFALALVMSGFALQRFTFIGFWPLKKGQKLRICKEIADGKYPFVFYESPKRILKTIEQLKEFLPGCHLFVTKELTKPYETSWRGSVETICLQLQSATLKGEFTVVVLSG
ncbi:MAG: 16S rRNA (cytidine(1402)-2'-O)-methyltransferase [Candidatus Margulisiibacteriota bacterium]|mgnify:CR=1 FL=1